MLSWNKFGSLAQFEAVFNTIEASQSKIELECHFEHCLQRVKPHSKPTKLEADFFTSLYSNKLKLRFLSLNFGLFVRVLFCFNGNVFGQSAEDRCHYNIERT